MSASDTPSNPTAQGGNTDQASSAGRAAGRGRGGRGRARGGRGRNNWNNRSGASNKGAGTSFKGNGNTDGMKNNVFQCHGENTDKQQFPKTVGVLEGHINKTFSYPQDVASACRYFEIVPLVQPENLTKEEYNEDMGKKMMWETSMKMYMKRTDLMESNSRAIYAIVWGQCIPMMQSKLESLEHYNTKSIACDCVWLLQEILGITHRFEGTRNVFISLDDAWSSYYAYRQGHNQTLHEYLKEFQALVQVLEHYRAALGAEAPYQDSVNAQIMAGDGLTPAEYRTRSVAVAKKKSVAIGFLKRAGRKRYGGLWSDLENTYTRGQDYYPNDLTGAYNLLLNYKPPPSHQPTRRDRHAHDDEEVSGLTFLQNTPPVPGTDGTTHERIKCYNCNTLGHYASACPKEEDEQGGVQMLQVAPDTPVETADEPYRSEFTFLNLQEQTEENNFLFHQKDERYSIIPDTWILLDSQSAVSVFKNSKFLLNIRPSPKKL
jgi:hypothetical protein